MHFPQPYQSHSPKIYAWKSCGRPHDAKAKKSQIIHAKYVNETTKQDLQAVLLKTRENEQREKSINEQRHAPRNWDEELRRRAGEKEETVYTIRRAVIHQDEALRFCNRLKVLPDKKARARA